MGKRFVPELFDDLDGSTPARTQTFGLNELSFTIDLGEANLARLQEALAPFIAVARPLGSERVEDTETVEPIKDGRSQQVAAVEVTELPEPIETPQPVEAPVLQTEQESPVTIGLGPELIASTEATVEEVLRSYEEAAKVFDTLDREDFRAWAESNGYPMPRGNRVSPPILNAYLIEREQRPVETAEAAGDEDEPVTEPITSLQVRRWARRNGLYVGQRGLIQTSVWNAFRDAHGLSAPETTGVAAPAEQAPVQEQDTAEDTETVADIPTPKVAKPVRKTAKKPVKKATKKTVAKKRDGRADNYRNSEAGQLMAKYGQQVVREWAQSAGLNVSAFGTLSARVYRAYEEHLMQTERKRAGKRRIYPAGIRDWARSQGYTVSNGKIDPAIVAAFYAAHPDA